MSNEELRTLERAALHNPAARRRWRFARWRSGGSFYEPGERLLWTPSVWMDWNHYRSVGDNGWAEQTFYSCVQTGRSPYDIGPYGPLHGVAVEREPSWTECDVPPGAAAYYARLLWVWFEEARSAGTGRLIWGLEVGSRVEEFADA